MDKKIDIDLALLHASFRYEPISGDLYWKGGSPFRNKKYNRAGWIGSNGYRSVKLKNQSWLVHVLIWVMHHGPISDASLEIDHIDRNPFNNRIENLRLVTRKQNQANTRRSPVSEKAA